MNENDNFKKNISLDESETPQRKLDEKLMELHTLFEVSQTINSSLNLNTILDNVLLTPMGKMLISRGIILLKDEEKNGFFVKSCKGLPAAELLERKAFNDFELTAPTNVASLENENGPVRDYFRDLKITLLLPIRSSDRLIGIVGLGAKMNGCDFQQSELAYLQSVANIAAPTVQNGLMVMKLQQVNRRLDKKILELNTLFEIGRELITTLDQKKILNMLSYAIMGEMLVNRCIIFLEADGDYCLASTKGMRPDDDLTEIRSQEFLQKLFGLKKPVDVRKKAASFSAGIWEEFQNMGFAVLVPMVLHDAVRGIIAIGEKITSVPFEAEDLEFLSTLGNEALISLENARLFQEELEKKRMEEELTLAREIQQKLLPPTCPSYKKFEIAGVNVSSLQVSGDYFDCIPLDEQRVCLAIADVSGKGTPASLLMANLQATLNALMEPNTNLVEITGKINNLIHKNTNYDKFITFFICVLDVESGELEYVNAGHNPPILARKDGNYDLLSTGGLLLGMMPNVPFEKGTTEMREGDWLVMYTDGVTEAQDKTGDEFGDERLIEFILKNRENSAEKMKQALLNEVKEFTENLPQSDDITLVIVKARN
ncbi:MAG: SpoIIE family protein phosphatase [Calditrichaeota bacterium]|nr:SpoIIE family protein phosphatase [Calditrichota bacterium]